MKRYRVVVFPNDLCRNFPRDDLFKNRHGNFRGPAFAKATARHRLLRKLSPAGGVAGRGPKLEIWRQNTKIIATNTSAAHSLLSMSAVRGLSRRFLHGEHRTRASRPSSAASTSHKL